MTQSEQILVKWHQLTYSANCHKSSTGRKCSICEARQNEVCLYISCKSPWAWKISAEESADSLVCVLGVGRVPLCVASFFFFFFALFLRFLVFDSLITVYLSANILGILDLHACFLPQVSEVFSHYSLDTFSASFSVPLRGQHQADQHSHYGVPKSRKLSSLFLNLFFFLFSVVIGKFHCPGLMDPFFCV